MVFTKMFRHPKYYKELRKLRNKLDQSISLSPSATAQVERSTGPGPKRQATSNKPQAPSLEKKEPSSLKRQAASFKRQATSFKLQDTENHGKVSRSLNQGAGCMIKVLVGCFT